jgi:hypothetical protein
MVARDGISRVANGICNLQILKGEGSAKRARMPHRFHARSFESQRDEIPDILIGCVDSREARKAIETSFTHALSGTCYWLDLGNNAASGQYVLGQPLNRRSDYAPSASCIRRLPTQSPAKIRCRVVPR